MDILLLNLYHPGISVADRQENLALAYLAAALRQQEFSCEILDATLLELPDEQALQQVITKAPSVLGITVMFQERLPAVVAFVNRLRRRGYQGFIVLGGHPASFLYREILMKATVDAVIVGAGEEPMLSLVSALKTKQEWRHLPGIAAGKDGQVSLSPCQPAANLDRLPFPVRDTLPLVIHKQGRKVASLLRSRGCPNSCSFCDTPGFTRLNRGPAWRTRKTENVAEEIEMLVKDFGVQHIQFWDDNFMGTGVKGREAALSLANTIITRNINITFSVACRVDGVDREVMQLLRTAGLQQVFLGVESGVARALETFHKRTTVEDNRKAVKILEDLGIKITVGFIMFDPYTTLPEVMENVDFLQEVFGSWDRVRRVLANPLNVLEVYAGTAIKDQLAADGLLKKAKDPCPPGYQYRFQDRKVAFLVGSLKGAGRLANPLKEIAKTQA